MTWPFIKTERYSINIVAGIIIILIIGIISSYYSVKYADRIVRSSLLEKTKIISSIFDIDDLSELTGTTIDLEYDYYKITKEKLFELAKINKDIRFVYLTGMREGEVFFFADSEPSNSIYYSPPGQVYEEASDSFKSVFFGKDSVLEGPISDRWGSWISALSPIIDPQTKDVVAVIGIDINSTEYYQTLIVYGLIPILISLLIISFIYFIYRMHKKEDILLALKSELVSIAAHDLRTPLVGLKWSLDSIVNTKNENLTDNQRMTFKLMQTTSTTLLETANQILEASRIEKQKEKALLMERVNFTNVIHEVISLYTFAIQEKDIKIVIDDDFPKDIDILCDKIKMKRVLSNLISNAIKYSTINKNITFKYSDSDKYHIISVSDQGIGIAEKDFRSIFKEYYRTDDAYQMSYGTGLGLYYVKKIVELHKGKISFTSKEGEGTTFIIELPK